MISLCLIIFHALDAPPSKCPETKSDTFCKADFMYYYVYPISDTFTLLASIIGLISNEFTGIASKTALDLLPVYFRSGSKIKIEAKLRILVDIIFIYFLPQFLSL